MSAHRKDMNKTTRGIVSGIDDKLIICRKLQPRRNLQAVVGFGDKLQPILQCAITNDKPVAASRQICPVGIRNSIDNRSQPNNIILTLPERTIELTTEAKRMVNLSKCPCFICTVVPTQARENTTIIAELLLNTEDKSVFGSSVLARGSDVRGCSGGSPKSNGIAKLPCVCKI